jgi:hypothetical protein
LNAIAAAAIAWHMSLRSRATGAQIDRDVDIFKHVWPQLHGSFTDASPVAFPPGFTRMVLDKKVAVPFPCRPHNERFVSATRSCQRVPHEGARRSTRGTSRSAASTPSRWCPRRARLALHRARACRRAVGAGTGVRAVRDRRCPSHPPYLALLVSCGTSSRERTVG